MNLQNEIGFVECLALHRKRRDTAVGLVHFTQAQKGLIWYRNLLARRQFSAALHHPAIQEIVRLSEVAAPEDLPALLEAARDIENKVKMGSF